MAKSSVLAITAAAVAILLLTAPHAASAITCGDVASAVAPCMAYARNGQGTPSASCCSGVKTLSSKAATTADRRTACNCLKNLAKSTSFNAGAVSGLPASAVSACRSPSAPPLIAPRLTKVTKAEVS